MKTLRRCLSYFRPFYGQTLWALALMVITHVLGVLRPWPLAILLDGVFRTSSTGSAPNAISAFFGAMPPNEALLWLVGAVIALQFIYGALNLAHTWRLVEIGLRVLLRLRAELYGHLQGLSLKFHDARRSGDATFRVTYDTQSIQTIYNRGFATILGSLISLGSILAVMLACSWKLTLVSISIIPFLLWSIYFFADRIRLESSAVQKEESDVLSRAQEGLTSIRIVQAFGRQKYEVRQFIQECEDSLSANMRLTMTNISSSLVVGLVTASGTAALFFTGGHQVVAGEISAGTFVLFTSYLTMLYQPLEQLSYTGWALAGATAGAERVFEILDTPDDVPDQPGAVPAKIKDGTISFEDLHFAYDEAHPVLRGVSFSVLPGQQVALVGGTGAGKSTILSLVARFYDPQQGVVRIDGTDIRQWTKASLRDSMSVVLQDTLLLTTTVRENIAYGRLDATQDDIIQAAQAAQAHDFISKLPQGYDTPVGERGVRLSGGQRQRLGIARAFLKNAPILLLDEPTSALDVQTEHEIMDAIERLMAGRTTLIVTHRLATIHNADLIHVLVDGRIVESGRGSELSARGGVYADLWSQALG